MTTQAVARPGRNEPCRCGSGRKYKHCCLAKDEKKDAAARAKAAKAEEAPATPPEEAPAPAAAPRAPKPKTDQPWKVGSSSSTRGFVPRSRTPRKVGGG
jgi:hypothetical protein